MRVLAILNGDIDINLQKFLDDNTVIICADGGGNYLFKNNIVPDILIGDMDSLEKKAYNFFEENKCRIKKFKREKDQTDGQLVIDEAISLNADHVDIFGALGGRIDHTLGNFQLLYRLVENNIECSIQSKNEIVYMSKNKFILQGEIGDVVSIIPYEKQTIISLKGFKYNVDNFEFLLNTPIGISNELVETTGEIDVKKGCALIVHNKNCSIL